MTFEELEKLVNNTIEKIEEEKKNNPNKEMSEGKKLFYDRCEAEHGGEIIVKKAACNSKTNKH